MEMGTMTGYQAVRTAIQELGHQATLLELADYVKQHFGIDLGDPKKLMLYIAMVNSKMSRKPRNTAIPASVAIAAR